ncbi:MAG: LptF/LptG family permease [Prevotellaceae bacterium]|nr:LptF/LptG family permease [Candidatus Colivivens equi]
MRIFKRLDTFVLSNFTLLFVGTFCICMFAVMMQFFWKYVDEVVGKGLDIWTITKFFFYAAGTLVSMALPLAILLASLISFGNMGERLELLSIKASGISLIRTMRPLIILMIVFSGVSFVFQNNIAPSAELKLMQMLWSMRQKSPELEIPENTFYSGIEGLNLYVHKKNKDTGMLYSVMIYDMREGVHNAHILIADSGYMESSADKKFLLLHMFSGNQFENFPSGTMNFPYRRETFVEKHFLIDFDMNLNMMDQENFTQSASTKGLKEVIVGIDSLERSADSISLEAYAGAKRTSLYIPVLADKDKQQKTTITKNINIDSLFAKQPTLRKDIILQNALQKIQLQQQEQEWASMQMEGNDYYLRRHRIQFWQIFATAFSCIVFFFVGAPLGAIIRKGGLGMPTVVAVLVFILYLMINTSGVKLAREGSIPAWIGVWGSTAVLAPLGIFLTIKSNNDSVVFNMDSYVIFFRKLFGIPTKRHIVRKEVIIHDPDYNRMSTQLSVLENEVRNYRANNKKLLQIQLIWAMITNKKKPELDEIINHLETCVEALSNSKDGQILYELNNFPIINNAPRFRNRARRECRTVAHVCKRLVEQIERVNNTQNPQIGSELITEQE